MKTDKVIRRFVARDGRTVILRTPRWEDLDDLLEYINSLVDEGADIVMLDNFSPSQIEEAIKLLKKNDLLKGILLEASGGITSENILTFASSGVNILSLSEITRNSKALDMSLEIIQVDRSRVKRPRVR